MVLSLGAALAADAGAQEYTISTVAGNGTASFSGDAGAATAATLNGPVGVALDAANNLYIADVNNERIRLISGGNISTLAGNGTIGYAGDGAVATRAEMFVRMVAPGGNKLPAGHAIQCWHSDMPCIYAIMEPGARHEELPPSPAGAHLPPTQGRGRTNPSACDHARTRGHRFVAIASGAKSQARGHHGIRS